MSPAPLSLQDRRALAAVAVQFFVNGAMTASFIARAPQIRDRIGVEVEGYGVLLTLAASTGIVASLLAGRILHVSSTRRVLTLGALIMVPSLPVIGAAHTPAVWLCGMVAYVFCDALVDVSMNLQGSWISARRHTPIMNRLHGLWSLGTLAGGLGAVGANGLGLSPLTHLLCVAVLATIVLVVVIQHLLPNDEQGRADSRVPAGAVEPGRPTRRLPSVLLALAGLFAVVTEVTGGDWATFRLADDFNASATLASTAFVAYTLGMTGMRFGGDLLLLRLGGATLFRGAIAVAGLGFAMAALVPDQAVSILGFFLVGLGIATLMPKLYDDAARLPGRRGAGLGAMTAGVRVATLITPLGVGALAGSSLSVGAAIALYSLPACVMLMAVGAWNERLLKISGH